MVCLIYHATRASRPPAATRRRSYTLRQLRPKLGADLFLRVGVAFGVVDGDVKDFLLFAFASKFGVAVGDGAFEVAHSETHF